MGLNYGPVFRRLWNKVHQIRRGRDRSLQRRFPIVDILFRSGDIRDRSAKSEIAPEKHDFRPQFFGAEEPKLWTWFLKLHPFPIMWQSFAAIGRETAEISWRIKKKLENVHWISVPVQIGDPIRGTIWRAVLKHYGPIWPLLIL